MGKNWGCYPNEQTTKPLGVKEWIISTTLLFVKIVYSLALPLAKIVPKSSKIIWQKQKAQLQNKLNKLTKKQKRFTRRITLTQFASWLGEKNKGPCHRSPLTSATGTDWGLNLSQEPQLRKEYRHNLLERELITQKAKRNPEIQKKIKLPEQKLKSKRLTAFIHENWEVIM